MEPKVEEEEMTVTRTEISNFFQWLGDKAAPHQQNRKTFRTERDDYLAGERNDIPSFRSFCANFDPANANDIGLERDIADGDKKGIDAYFGAGEVTPQWFLR